MNVDELNHQDGKYRLGRGHVLGAKLTKNVDELIHQNEYIHDLEKGHALGAKLTTNVDELIHQNGKSMTWKGHVLGAKLTTNVDELIHQNGKYRLGKVMHWVLNSRRMSMS
jgi:ribosomal protein S16